MLTVRAEVTDPPPLEFFNFSYFPQITLFWPATLLPWPPSLSDVLSSIDSGPARPPPRQHLLRQVLSSSPPPFALGLQQRQPDKYKDQTEHNKPAD